MATDERLLRIAKRLERSSEEEAEHCLRWRAQDVREGKDPEAAIYFNGVTNWREDSFEFALGQTLEKQQPKRDVSTGHAKPAPASAFRGGDRVIS
jgi:hypothetical protein